MAPLRLRVDTLVVRWEVVSCTSEYTPGQDVVSLTIVTLLNYCTHDITWAFLPLPSFLIFFFFFLAQT